MSGRVSDEQPCLVRLKLRMELVERIAIEEAIAIQPVSYGTMLGQPNKPSMLLSIYFLSARSYASREIDSTRILSVILARLPETPFS